MTAKVVRGIGALLGSGSSTGRKFGVAVVDSVGDRAPSSVFVSMLRGSLGSYSFLTSWW